MNCKISKFSHFLRENITLYFHRVFPLVGSLRNARWAFAYASNPKSGYCYQLWQRNYIYFKNNNEKKWANLITRHKINFFTLF